MQQSIAGLLQGEVFDPFEEFLSIQFEALSLDRRRYVLSYLIESLHEYLQHFPNENPDFSLISNKIAHLPEVGIKDLLDQLRDIISRRSGFADLLNKFKG